MKRNENLPASEHFQLEQLAGGVYAAIASPGGRAFSNSGIVDLGDQTLVFDAFETRAAAGDLKSAAEQLTGHPVSVVIISHCHADHWGGNQVFAPETSIITTHITRKEMPAAIGWLVQLKENPSESEQAIQETREQLEAEMDERQRASLSASIAAGATLPRADLQRQARLSWDAAKSRTGRGGSGAHRQRPLPLAARRSDRLYGGPGLLAVPAVHGVLRSPGMGLAVRGDGAVRRRDLCAGPRTSGNQGGHRLAEAVYHPAGGIGHAGDLGQAHG
jgi:hypothetical protein